VNDERRLDYCLTTDRRAALDWDRTGKHFFVTRAPPYEILSTVHRDIGLHDPYRVSDVSLGQAEAVCCPATANFCLCFKYLIRRLTLLFYNNTTW